MGVTDHVFQVPRGSSSWHESVPNPVGLDAQVELYHRNAIGMSRMTLAPAVEHHIDVYRSTVEVHLPLLTPESPYLYMLRIR